MGFRLALSYRHHTIGVSGDVILYGNGNLVDVLEAKAPILVSVAACANVEKLGVELPHLRTERPLLVAVVQDQGDAVDTFFYGVKAISSQAVQKTRIHDLLDFGEEGHIALNHIEDSPHGSEGGHRCQN